MRTADIYVFQKRAGSLTEDDDGKFVFCYGKTYLDDPAAIAVCTLLHTKGDTITTGLKRVESGEFVQSCRNQEAENIRNENLRTAQNEARGVDWIGDVPEIRVSLMDKVAEGFDDFVLCRLPR